MLKKDNATKVLEVFFDNPVPDDAGFQLREICRKIELAPKSVKNYLEILEKNNLIFKRKNRVQGYPVYYANRDDDYFKFLKKLNILKRIKESGLIDYIENNCKPDVIFLFGSASRGEDIEKSDIDLFIQCNEKKLNLKKYEKELHRKINPFFEKDFDKLSKELKLNIINGIKLRGYLNFDV